MTRFLKFFVAFSNVFVMVQACQGSVGEQMIYSTDPKRICRWDFTVPSGSQLYMVPKKLNMDANCLDSIDIFIRDHSGKIIFEGLGRSSGTKSHKFYLRWLEKINSNVSINAVHVELSKTHCFWRNSNQNYI